jgi:hypothetical protein
VSDVSPQLIPGVFQSRTGGRLDGKILGQCRMISQVWE